jgi:hypothetical protein
MTTSAWESAEGALAYAFLVFSECETPNSYNAVRRAFGSIESSGGRRRAIEAAAEIYFGASWPIPVIKNRFKELMTAFENASRRRDEIAHGITTSISVDNKNKGAFLFPPGYNTQRTHAYFHMPGEETTYMSEKFRYTSQDIRTFRLKFSDLAQKTINYVPKIKKMHGVPAMLWGDNLKTQGMSDERLMDFCKQNGLKLEDLSP